MTDNSQSMSQSNPSEMAVGWRRSILSLGQPPVISLFFLGISAGIPLLLIFSSLSLWLREAGVDRSAVTYFSWAALGYSFKFVWAPLVDRLSLPWLTDYLGRRRSWLLLSQLMIMLSIGAMASIDPASQTLTAMAIAAVLLGFSSATQDIVIDAYRIESAPDNLQALMSSTYVAGYRVGMLLAGAGALFLAAHLGSTAEHYDYSAWRTTYLIMAGLMLIGVVTTLLITEPSLPSGDNKTLTAHSELGFLLLFVAAVAGFIGCYLYSANLAITLKQQLSALLANSNLSAVVIELCRLTAALLVATGIARLVVRTGVVEIEHVKTAYLDPVKDFFQRYGLRLAWTLLVLIGFYRVSDIVLGVISNLFYQDLGYSKTTIAQAVKLFGLLMTILGGLLGGIMALRFGVIRMLLLGAVLSSLTNLLFVLLAQADHNLNLLYLVIAADNLSAGLASAAFIAFLSSLTNISFTATQYAIFSSLMTLMPKALGGYSGSIVDALGYETFFTLSALIGLPVIVLIFAVRRLIAKD